MDTRMTSKPGGARRDVGYLTRGVRFVTLAIAIVIAAACGSASTGRRADGTANTGKIGGKLIVDNESGSTWTCQFNPFNPSVNITSIGFVYEPLEFVNILQTNTDGSAKVTPWLATESSWRQQLRHADLDDPKRCEMERRHAVHRERRRVHVQGDEG